MKCEAGHLCEIAHRRFAGVCLPIRVRSETNGSIKTEIGRDRAESLWIPRQNLLQSQNCIQHHGANRAENKNRGRVSRPLHFDFGFYAAKRVDYTFERAEPFHSSTA